MKVSTSSRPRHGSITFKRFCKRMINCAERSRSDRTLQYFSFVFDGISYVYSCAAVAFNSHDYQLHHRKYKVTIGMEKSENLTEEHLQFYNDMRDAVSILVRKTKGYYSPYECMKLKVKKERHFDNGYLCESWWVI